MRLLLIGGDADSAAMIRASLEELDHHVEVADTAGALRALAVAQHYDVVMLDGVQADRRTGIRVTCGIRPLVSAA